MIHNDRSRQMLVGAVAALLTVTPMSVPAQDVQALKRQLEAMQQQVQVLTEKIGELEAKQTEPQAQGVKFDAKKLQIQSTDGDFKIRMGGRLMVDGALYDNDGDTDLGSGTEFRRARLRIDGTLYKYWDFRGQYDFAPGDEVEVKDAYIRYRGLKPGINKLTVGHFKEPFSLEELTSSRYITFMERAMVVDAFAPSRNLGIGAQTEGKLASGGWGAGFGVFANGFDAPGEDDSEGYAVTGRLTVAPIASKDRVLHLGAAASHRTFDQGERPRFRARPESHVTNIRLVNTDRLPADSITRVGLEAAGVFGPFSVQGEYIHANVELDDGAGGFDDPDFDGWYAFASWFLTGESRPYDAGGGDFGRVKPKANFPGGIGAWEVAARYSSLDLSEADPITGAGGEQDNVTLGLNWYVNPQVRFMANYVKVVDLEDPAAGASEGDEPGVFQLRAQIDF